MFKRNRENTDPSVIADLPVVKESPARPQIEVVKNTGPETRDFLAMHKKRSEMSEGHSPYSAPAAAVLDLHRRFGQKDGLFVPAGYGVEIRSQQVDKVGNLGSVEEFHEGIHRLGGFTVATVMGEMTGNSFEDPARNLLTGVNLRDSEERGHRVRTSRVMQLETLPTLEQLLDTTFPSAVNVFNELNVRDLHFGPTVVNAAVANARAADANPALIPIYRP